MWHRTYARGWTWGRGCGGAVCVQTMAWEGKRGNSTIDGRHITYRTCNLRGDMSECRIALAEHPNLGGMLQWWRHRKDWYSALDLCEYIANGFVACTFSVCDYSNWIFGRQFGFSPSRQIPSKLSSYHLFNILMVLSVHDWAMVNSNIPTFEDIALIPSEL